MQPRAGGANPEEESSGRASFGGVRSRPYAVAPSIHVRRMPFAPTPRPIEEGGGRTRRSVPPTLDTRGANAIRPYQPMGGMKPSLCGKASQAYPRREVLALKKTGC